MSDTKFGVAYPTGMEGLMYPVPFCDTSDLVAIAETAESFEYHSIGGNDHIITQDYVKEEWEKDPRYYDVFNTFSYIAAKTDEIHLNTAVTVLPLRDPVWVAKQAMTLDQLSDGRVILGTGVGAYREEFEAINPEVSLPRGKIMDESVEALSVLLEDGPTNYEGSHVRFEDVDLYPKPKQDPFPLYVGGNHENALRRAVQHGRGWLPAGLTPSEIADRTENLVELCQKYDRDPDEIEVAPQLIATVGHDGTSARDIFKRSQVFEHLKSLTGATLKDQSLDDLTEQNLIGTPDDIIKKIQNYRDVGVTHFPAIIFAANDIPDLKQQMRVFAEHVMPSFT